MSTPFGQPGYDPGAASTRATMSPGRPEVDDRGGVYARGVHDPRTEPTPAYAQGPGGPVPFDTQRGFEAQADQPPGALTPEEIAEFRALREEKKRRDAEAAAEAEAAAARLQEPTHYVHLATGDVVKGSTIATHYDDGDGLVAVTSVHEIDPVVIG